MTNLHHHAAKIRELSPERHSAAELFAVLFFGHHLRFDHTNPHWPARDRLIIASPSLRPLWFSTLQARGLLSAQDHNHHRANDWRIHDRHHVSLKHGLRGAITEAKQLHQEKLPAQVYLLLDGHDQSKGELWGFAHQASEQALSNLITLIDVDSSLLEQAAGARLAQRWQSFDWQVQEVGGHNLLELDQALNQAKAHTKPSVIIAYTQGER